MADPKQPDELIDYTCNICGSRNRRWRSTLSREAASCDGCHSTVRMRAMVFLVTRHLHGPDMPLFRARPSEHVGLGLSDWAGYAGPLADKTGYLNTFYTREPQLDITKPPPERLGSADFIIATDVFEHVLPPAQAAFKGAAALLKPGGLLAFSVPYGFDEETVEHFPDLHDFRIEGRGEDRRLINRTRDGRTQTFEALCFHGGEGATLEMRLFSLPALRRECLEAGLLEPELLEEVPGHGIVWIEPWSRAMAIRKPGGGVAASRGSP